MVGAKDTIPSYIMFSCSIPTRSSHLQTTIVITTHYIEEARQANVVGMMRFGRLLAEGHPDTLLEEYRRDTLEDVFLHLCMGDDTKEADKQGKRRKEKEEGEEEVGEAQGCQEGIEKKSQLH